MRDKFILSMKGIFLLLLLQLMARLYERTSGYHDLPRHWQSPPTASTKLRTAGLNLGVAARGSRYLGSNHSEWRISSSNINDKLGIWANKQSRQDSASIYNLIIGQTTAPLFLLMIPGNHNRSSDVDKFHRRIDQARWKSRWINWLDWSTKDNSSKNRIIGLQTCVSCNPINW